MHDVIKEKPLNNENLALQAIRIARYISLFGIVPTLLLSIFISMEKSLGFGNHGVPVFVLTTYGVIVPTFMILKSKRMKSFAKHCFVDAVRNLPWK